MCDFFNFFKILILWVVKGLKGQKSIQNNKNALCHALYFRKHIFIYDAQVWKDNISRHFFHFFKILIFEIIRGFLRAKNGPKWQNILCLTPYLRNVTSYYCDFWYTSVKSWYLQQFFHFFKMLIFLVFRGVKGQKMT